MNMAPKYRVRRWIAGAIAYVLFAAFCIWLTTDGYDLITHLQKVVAGNV